jgi:hypothetical protein
MRFAELTQVAKERAYAAYVKAMDDDLNRDSIVSIEAYEAEADWDKLDFDVDGNVIP